MIIIKFPFETRRVVLCVQNECPDQETIFLKWTRKDRILLFFLSLNQMQTNILVTKNENSKEPFRDLTIFNTFFLFLFFSY
jgi:hypothetical protein